MKEIGQRIIESLKELVKNRTNVCKCSVCLSWGDDKNIIIESELSALRAEQGNPVEQSKLSAEEIMDKANDYGTYWRETWKESKMSKLAIDECIISFARGYQCCLSQFEGKELPEEELREGLPENYMTLVRKALKEGHRLEAIKIHYENTKRASLKESKKIVDEIWNTEFKNR